MSILFVKSAFNRWMVMDYIYYSACVPGEKPVTIRSANNHSYLSRWRKRPHYIKTYGYDRLRRRI